MMAYTPSEKQKKIQRGIDLIDYLLLFLAFIGLACPLSFVSLAICTCYLPKMGKAAVTLSFAVSLFVVIFLRLKKASLASASVDELLEQMKAEEQNPQQEALDDTNTDQ